MLGLRTLSAAAALVVAMIVAWQVVPAQAQNVPNGSYRQSCRNIHMESRDDLAAECRRQNGNWRNTKIDIDKCRGRDIRNDNGDLECGGYRYAGSYGRYQVPGGSWNQSCRNARIVRDDLVAECRQRDGDWIRTRLDLDDCRGRAVTNDNGRLRCGESGHAGYTMPGGSWNQSCRNAQIRGDDLVAECRERDGSWNRTSLDLDGCRGRPVSNQNGRLQCAETGQAGHTMPRGSWTQSCRNAQIRGDDLYAECRGRDGRWHNTRIDLDRCPNRGLTNDNGELRCT
ncbi:MAG: hypothetical protein K0S54_2504 [Alphaproteobacteria bacterium]|nr:hypothetical protein [Alphaproteobacteria bacterium]